MKKFLLIVLDMYDLSNSSKRIIEGVSRRDVYEKFMREEFGEDSEEIIKELDQSTYSNEGVFNNEVVKEKDQFLSIHGEETSYLITEC